MFFLGISAHLLIYLLVPALLVVCFYFRGTAGNPEVTTLLPEVIVYKQISSQYSENTYVFKAEKQQKRCVKKQMFTFYLLPVFDTPLYISSSYLAPLLCSNTLRAPPELF